ncbi:hypothetical protein GOV05_01310 [Candidatus Woesearchaeota archaeon]|nr:hypothetical protein [Candidatus Woesearchaeota archaeon]
MIVDKFKEVINKLKKQKIPSLKHIQEEDQKLKGLEEKEDKLIKKPKSKKKKPSSKKKKK